MNAEKKAIVLTPQYYLDIKKWFILPHYDFRKGSTVGQWGSFKKLTREDFNRWRTEAATTFENDHWLNGFKRWGAGLILGKPNEIIMVDTDSKELFGQLSVTKTPQINTWQGGHLLFRWNDEFCRKLAKLGVSENLKEGDLELRINGVTPLPPYKHPLGKVYEWIYLDEEIAELSDKWKDKFLEIATKQQKKNKQKDKNSLFKTFDWEFRMFCEKTGISLPIQDGERFIVYCSKCVGWICRWLGERELRIEAVKDEALNLAEKYVDLSIDRKEIRKSIIKAVNKFYENDEQERRKKEDITQQSENKIKRFSHLTGELLESAVRLTNSPQINYLAGHLRLGQHIVIFGRPAMGKTSLIEKILEDNTPRYRSCLIILENTQTSLDETAFNQWVYKNNKHDKPYYLKDYLFRLDFYPDHPLKTKEEHQTLVKEFIEHKLKEKGIDSIMLDYCNIETLEKTIISKIQQGYKLFGLDSLTLLEQKLKFNQLSSDAIKSGLIKLKNALESNQAFLISAAHVTPSELEGDKIYGSSHYKNFSDKVIEIRKPNTLNAVLERKMAEEADIYISRELYWHKNRPYDKDWALQYLYHKGTGEIKYVEKSENLNKPRKQAQMTETQQKAGVSIDSFLT